MKKLLLSILTTITLTILSAQIVNIPDANFKAYLVGNSLINLNNDTEIQVGEASNFSGEISINGLTVSDLTGLEAFTNIQWFKSFNNSLNTLDVSSNTALGSLICVGSNLTTLDLSNNLLLFRVSVENNFIDSIDISLNTAVHSLSCYNNALTYLNAANGNNTSFSVFNVISNPNLTCIKVDNPTWSTANWSSVGPGASFSLDCTPCTINIPDANFKANLVNNSLINTNGDTEIQCSEATAFTGTIDCASSSIGDMTGIEAFINLDALYCGDNFLAGLDVTENVNLTILWCEINTISNLNLSQNSNLQNLDCSVNQLTNINLTQNNSLTKLSCHNNLLTNLDVSQNISLTEIFCDENSITDLNFSDNPSLIKIDISLNSLTLLNVANSNNTIITYFKATGNPNLTCVQVDDATYSTTNWTNIDATASFSTDCNYNISVNSITVQGQSSATTITTQGGTLQMEASVLPANADDATYTWSVDNANATISTTGMLTAVADGTVEVKATANDGSGTVGTKTITISNQTGGGNVAINNLSFEALKVFPNPTNGIVNISANETLQSIILLDITGKQIKSFDSNATQLNVSDVSSGIYFLEVANESKKSVVKLIIR